MRNWHYVTGQPSNLASPARRMCQAAELTTLIPRNLDATPTCLSADLPVQGLRAKVIKTAATFCPEMGRPEDIESSTQTSF